MYLFNQFYMPKEKGERIKLIKRYRPDWKVSDLKKRSKKSLGLLLAKVINN